MEENNKRIAKNTIYLYVRMLIMTALGFITTRIVLDKLGVSDYGIYTLVGGFVGMFTVLNNILNTGTNRFIALALGKGDFDLQKITFSTSFTLHVIIAFIIFLLLESFGLWYLNTNLNIEPDRMYAANWVFQFSVVSASVSITQTPYTASVTAHEKFNLYAIMSIFDATSKLVILYLLIIVPGDKLIVYSALLFIISLTNLFIYRIYCIRKFKECCMSLKIDRSLLKEMTNFAGWSAFGHIITVVNSQGIAIILNLFFSTVMNAARGLAHTVNLMIANFIAGFMTAAQPQLIKYYGIGDMERFKRLIFNATQYSLFLLALFTVPVILEIDYVINLWLGGNVPPYTCTFVKITMICGIIYRSNTMIDQGITAAGFVKLLNTISIPVYLLSIPLFYFVLWMGWGPVIAYWIGSVPPLLAFLLNLGIIKKKLNFPSGRYFIHIFCKNILLIIISMIIPYLIQKQMQSGLFRFLIVCTVSVLSTSTIIWSLGLNNETRDMVKTKILGKYIKKFK